MKNLIKTLGASLLLLAIFTGCSSKDMQVAQNNDALKKPENGNAKILFYRSSTLGYAVQSSIFVIKDNSPKVVGIVGAKKKMVYELNPGKYIFMVLGEASDFMYAEVDANKMYYVNIVPRMGLWKARFSLEPKDANLVSQEALNSYILVEPNKNTIDWYNENYSSVLEKYNEYFEKWMSKDISSRPKLYPDFGK